ncbi:MAG: peroxidase family protein, partial [Cyanobacteria bacterium J06649_11]
DLLVGLFAEDATAPSGAGETTQAIVGEQFERLRDADRFWFERKIKQGGFFTKKEIKEIQQTSFADIIKLNTGIEELQENVFIKASEDNPLNSEIPEWQVKAKKAEITFDKQGWILGKGTFGFYPVLDKQGKIVDEITGQTLTPKDGESYEKAAINNSVGDFQLKQDSSKEKIELNLPSYTLLAPYFIEQGNIEDFENGKAEALLSFGSTDKDNSNNIIKLSNDNSNTFEIDSDNFTDFNSDNTVMEKMS